MKRRLTARLTGAVVLATGVVAALATPATSTPQATQASPVNLTDSAANPLDAMERDLGLTAEQAQQRLGQEAVADRADQLLRTALGAAYGGSFFDAAQGKLVVGVTNLALFPQVSAAGAVPRQVRFSSADLGAVASGLSRAGSGKSQGVSGWYVDSASNSVVVTAARGSLDRARSFVGSAGVNQAAVRVVESAEAPHVLADVIGGNGYNINNTARCSIGFAVNGGFVSSGHCGNKGDTTTQPDGTFADSSFPGNDYSYVQTAPSETPRPLVNKYDGTNVTVAGSQEAAEGTSVCRSGSTTGWHCGTIQAKNQTVNYQQGVVNGLTRTNVCAEPGDSGGPFLSDTQAQGVTSGGSGDCTSGGTTYFQPVNPILQAYGLTLLTQ